MITRSLVGILILMVFTSNAPASNTEGSSREALRDKEAFFHINRAIDRFYANGAPSISRFLPDAGYTVAIITNNNGVANFKIRNHGTSFYNKPNSLRTLPSIDAKNLIGTYKGGMPDRSVEILKLKMDGVCEQTLILKGGQRFSTTGKWIYYKPHNSIELKGVYICFDINRNLIPNFDKEKNTLCVFGVNRLLSHN